MKYVEESYSFLRRSRFFGKVAHSGSKYLKPAQKSSLTVISRIFASKIDFRFRVIACTSYSKFVKLSQAQV